MFLRLVQYVLCLRCSHQIEKVKRGITMYIKNRRDSSKFKAYGLYETLLLTESLIPPTGAGLRPVSSLLLIFEPKNHPK